MSMLPEVIAWLELVPAGFLCLAPVVHRLKRGFQQTAFSMPMLFAVLAFVLACAARCFPLPVYTMLPLMLLACTAGFRLSVRIPLYKMLPVAFGVWALMTILESAACLIEAGRIPKPGGETWTLMAGLVRIAVNAAAVLLLFRPARKYGSRLMDRLENWRIWLMTIPLSLALIILSLVIHPGRFAALPGNNQLPALAAVILSALIIWMAQWSAFCLTATGMLDAEERKEKLRLLEMQESQFRAMKQYMEDSARARHDFRQCILTIRNLFHEGKHEALGKYIDEYDGALPRTVLKMYCENSAVNALLNHYAAEAEENRIPVSFRVDIPEKTGVEDTDLCSIIGNILENGITACTAIPEEERRISLAVQIQNGSRLFIAAANAFSGEVRVHGGEYFSSGRKGSGIGLKSVRALTEKYSGKAMFSHEGKEFRSDVVLKV